jgi:hypothetical protein
MKLIEYNSENSSHKVPKFPAVRITHGAGTFCFNKEAVELMDLTHDSSVVVCQDADSPRDFYIRKSENPAAFKLRQKINTYYMLFSCGKVAKSILSAAKVDKSAAFRISKEKIEMGGGYLLFNHHSGSSRKVA